MKCTDNSQVDKQKRQIERALAERPQGVMGQVRQVKTAVLLPLVPQNGGLSVLFEERAHTLRRQPGEISFPGGHAESTDRDECATALRETSEELGIPVEGIQYIGKLDILTAWSGLVVHPFVGYIESPEGLRPNPSEVASTFLIDLARLLEFTPAVYEVPLKPQPPDDFPYDLIPNGRQYQWRSLSSQQYFYELDGRVIWGLTARILKHFLDVVRGATGRAL